MKPKLRKITTAVATVAAIAVAASIAWNRWHDDRSTQGLASGNGRIEATAVSVATKQPGRIDEILVGEGDFVKAGQVVARMQVSTLQAQRDEALARLAQAREAVAGTQAQVALRESDLQAAAAVVGQRESELDAARRRLARSETLAREGASSGQELDDDRARVSSLEAALAAARAQVGAARAAVTAARTQVAGTVSSVRAAEATIARIDVEFADTELKAPRDGRIQFRVAQPGEVLGAGGKVLSLLDLTDVYMTFFLPETVAGRVALGAEVRIVLDAAPAAVIPAKVSFVASAAQFTPRTVETASERQKLMFRVRARIAPELLARHLEQVKTGLPGVAWIRLDEGAAWPANLDTNLVR